MVRDAPLRGAPHHEAEGKSRLTIAATVESSCRRAAFASNRSESRTFAREIARHRHRKTAPLPQNAATHMPQRARSSAFHRRDVAAAPLSNADPNRFFRIAVA
jgi:hypothetical protein